MNSRLKSIVEKYSLKETDGFEGKKSTKETNVEEDLRKNYETGKMVPYQSVIAEGKIVGNTKASLKEAKLKITVPPKILKKLENYLIEMTKEIIDDMELTFKKGKEQKALERIMIFAEEFMEDQAADHQDSSLHKDIKEDIRSFIEVSDEEDEDEEEE